MYQDSHSVRQGSTAAVCSRWLCRFGSRIPHRIANSSWRRRHQATSASLAHAVILPLCACCRFCCCRWPHHGEYHQVGYGTYVISSGERTIELKTSSLQNLLPMVPRVFNERARKAVEGLCAIYNGSTVDVMDQTDEISQILDFFFAKTLAPAVVVSNDEFG